MALETNPYVKVRVAQKRMTEPSPKHIQVGQFARQIGKTVRAIHLYEEMGLLRPIGRTKGGFRLYNAISVERARWIIKLQGIGFTLAQIQGFVADFETSSSGRDATSRARDIFEAKLENLRQQLNKLQSSEQDLVEALEYLDACGACSSDMGPIKCKYCDQQGHDSSNVPELFAGLSESAAAYDVDVDSLHRGKNQGVSDDR